MKGEWSMLNIKQIVNKIFDKYELYLVGGSVRDTLIQNIDKINDPSINELLVSDSRDLDFATNASPDDLLALFKDYEDFLILDEVSYGIIKFKTSLYKDCRDTIVINVTTYRKETYRDVTSEDTVIEYTKTLREYLSRRDFTINAMAFRFKILRDDEEDQYKIFIKFKEIVDDHVYAGIKDIQKNVIRSVANISQNFDFWSSIYLNKSENTSDELSKELCNKYAQQVRKRFEEDPLRILRMIRLAMRFGFDIDPYTYREAMSVSDRLKDVSDDRISMEIRKIIEQGYKGDIKEFRNEFKRLCQIKTYNLSSIFDDYVEDDSYNEFDVEDIRFLLSQFKFDNSEHRKFIYQSIDESLLVDSLNRHFEFLKNDVSGNKFNIPLLFTRIVIDSEYFKKQGNINIYESKEYKNRFMSLLDHDMKYHIQECSLLRDMLMADNEIFSTKKLRADFNLGDVQKTYNIPENKMSMMFNYILLIFASEIGKDLLSMKDAYIEKYRLNIYDSLDSMYVSPDYHDIRRHLISLGMEDYLRFIKMKAHSLILYYFEED